jgi:hypothetical protein
MADVSVDATISTSTGRGSRSVVYATDDIGYMFYIDSDGVFGYSKTTDGGATWGAQVNVDSGAQTTVLAFDVWFDQWTPGDTGTKIHCWWFDTTNDDVIWRTLDTNGDSLGTQRIVFAGATSVVGRGVFVSGTKTVSGYLYCAYDIDAGAERGLHRSTDDGTSWSASLSSTFVEATLDTCFLYPASGTGDNNDCWALYYDASATALTLKLWDSSAASATESATIQTHTDGNVDLTGQFGFAGAIRHSDGHLIVAAVSLRDNASSTHQVFDCTSTSSIATKTAITTNIDDHYWPQVFVSSNDTIHVAYVGKRDGLETLDVTAKVYYTKSTDGGTTWSAGDTAYMEGAAAAVQQMWTPLNGNRFAAVWRVGSTLVTNKVNSLVFLDGTLASTLDALTSSGTGTVDVQGSTSATLDALTSAATGTVAVQGSTAATLDAATLAGTGTVDVQGVTSATLEAATVSATGTVDSGSISGSLAVTLDAVTSSATGTVDVQGSTSATLGAVTTTASGTVSDGPSGSLSVTLDALTSTATGTIAVQGTLSATLDAVSSTATGTVAVQGTTTATLGELTGVATGTVAVTGSTAAALDGLTTTATGTVAVTGSTTATLAALTVAGEGVVGEPPIEGTLAVTLAAATVTGTGTVLVSGTTAATLDALTASATGSVEVSGAGSATLGALTSAATGTVAIAGTASVTLELLTVTGTGGPAVSGTLAATLAPLTSAGLGTVTVTGTLTGTLGALTLVASGTVSDAPPLPPAWRTTDAVVLDDEDVGRVGDVGHRVTFPVVVED